MKITEAEVQYVADLAHLRLTAEELARMAREMNAILEHMETLNRLDTSAVPPMAQVLYDAPDTATWRADQEGTPLPNDVALANAPLAGAGCFKVPKVIER